MIRKPMRPRGVASLGVTAAIALLVLPLTAAQSGSGDRLPGMPPLLDARDVYAAARPGPPSPAARDAVARIYVPNSGNGTVDVIDPATFKIVDHFTVGSEPQHV